MKAKESQDGEEAQAAGRAWFAAVHDYVIDVRAFPWRNSISRMRSGGERDQHNDADLGIDVVFPKRG